MAFAFAYADKHGLPVVGVTVAATAFRDTWSDGEFPAAAVTAEPAACALLAREMRPWQRAYPSVPVKAAVFTGAAADGLLRAARGARLLVVGAHTAPGLRALLGSTSLDLVGRATCPVAVRQPLAAATGKSSTHKEVHDVRA
jgi:nucleotide-binding universal stress UspA family protein